MSDQLFKPSYFTKLFNIFLPISVMDWYIISVLVFFVLLVLFVYRDRKNFKRESIFLLSRTQAGKRFITKVGSRFPRGWKVVGGISVAVGFIASVMGFNLLLQNVQEIRLRKNKALARHIRAFARRNCLAGVIPDAEMERVHKETLELLARLRDDQGFSEPR